MKLPIMSDIAAPGAAFATPERTFFREADHSESIQTLPLHCECSYGVALLAPREFHIDHPSARDSLPICVLLIPLHLCP